MERAEFEMTSTQRDALVAALLKEEPCALLGHRPAYLRSGGIACHTCGRRL